MKKITQKLLFLTMTVMGVSIASAQVPANGLWYPVGNTTLATVTDDGDNGDGVADGAIEVIGLDAIPDLGAKFTFNGTMQDATTYAISTAVYNTVNSFVNFKVSLHNATDDVQLAVSSTISIDKPTAEPVGTKTQTISLSYTSTTTDIGDVLEVRYIRVDNNITRKFKIDNLSLNTTFVTEVLQPVSPVGTFGVINAGTAISFETTGVNIGSNTFSPDADGAIFVNGSDGVDPQGAKYTLTETMVAGKRYKAETTGYKASNSFSKIILQLWNAIDGMLLAESAELSFTDSTFKTGSVTYDAKATDAGDVLEIRWKRTDGGATYRDFSIDVAKINDAAITISAAVLSVADDVLSQGISIYPNPTNSILNIQSIDSNIKIENVRLMDITGKTVYTSNSAQPINVEKFSKGVYILRIESQDGGVASKKVIVN
ncbi:MAG: T9SS type A sorting domain-containing protein [Lutibacter sp.]|nr:T9SS type A sorting domain-containing protein [Lutibacter sp.]